MSDQEAQTLDRAKIVIERLREQVAKRVWHCLRVQEGMDARVGADLCRQRYRHFVAFRFEKLQLGNRVVPYPTPRFPGYVFVQRRREQEFRPIVETLGVAEVLSIGGIGPDGFPRPSVVPDQVIDIFNWDMVEDYDEATRRVRRKDCLYAVGDRIIIHRPGSPWEGREFTVEETRPGRVRVSLPNGWPLPFLEADVAAAPKKKLLSVAAR